MMRKKLSVLFLSAAVLCASFSAFAACEKPHEHKFSSEWTGGELGHWHECECGEKSDFADHVWENDGSCETCGYSVFGGTYEEITLEQAKSFAEKLQSDGKAFDWKEGYQISSRINSEETEKDGGGLIYFTEYSANINTAESDGEIAAQAMTNITSMNQGGGTAEVGQVKTWYWGRCAYVESYLNVLDKEKYKAEMPFDGYLESFGYVLPNVFDMAMLLGLASSGAYKEYSVLSCDGTNYQKYKIVFPSQAVGEVTDTLTVTLVYDEENALLACDYDYQRFYPSGTEGGPGSDGDVYMKEKLSVSPYAGTVEPPDDPDSFPERTE